MCEVAISSTPKVAHSPLTNALEFQNITALLKDKSGVFWIGTPLGLYRFDGSSLDFFNSDKSNQNWIPSSHITGLAEHSDGIVMATTAGGGLLIWEKNRGRFSAITRFGDLEARNLSGILASKSGAIWLQSGELLFRIPAILGEDSYSDANSVYREMPRPLSIVELDKGLLLLGTEKGAFLLDEEATVIKPSLQKLEYLQEHAITALSMLNGDIIYIGTDSGILAMVDIRSNRIVAQTTIGQEASTSITSILPTSTDIVIGTDRGLYISSSKLENTTNVSTKGSGLSNNEIQTLYGDGENIWIGTYNGLNILTFSPFQHHKNSNSGISNDVVSFFEDRNERLWVGTFSGLFYFDNTNGNHDKYKSDTPGSMVIGNRISALDGNRNELWIGHFRNGVHVLDLSTGNVTAPKIDDINSLSITSILASDFLDSVWLGSFSSGLIRVSSNAVINYGAKDGLPENFISSISENDSGRVLIAGRERVYQFQPSIGRFHLISNRLGSLNHSPTIFSLAQDGNNNVWVGTKEQGIFKLIVRPTTDEDGLIEIRKSSQFLSTSTIYAIEIDNDGNIWCSTQHGLIKIDSNGNLLSRFLSKDGLQANDFDFGSSYKNNNGELFFGGSNGYNRFHPDEVKIDLSPTPMKLTRVTFPQDRDRPLLDVSKAEKLVLSHEDKVVTLGFAVLDFFDPGKNQYRYMLENFDENWTDNGSNSFATYTNLPPGNYMFRAQGSNSSGIWNREGIALEIQVLPPPWKSWWAYCLYLVAFAVVCWGIHRIHQSFVVRKQALKLEQESLAMEIRASDDLQEHMEMQDLVVNSAYEHNASTLSLIQTVLGKQVIQSEDNTESGASQSGLKSVMALRHLEHCIEYHADRPVANIHQYVDILITELLLDTPVRPDTIISINNTTEAPIATALASPLAVILYELLENCMQHAFGPESPVNYIDVNLSSKRDNKATIGYWELTVRDNGIGVASHEAIDTSAGNGLALVESLAQSMGGSFTLESSSGTLVIIKVPIQDEQVISQPVADQDYSLP